MKDYRNNIEETKWNFDDERMKVLHMHMIECEYAFEDWNLNKIYSKLKIIEIIISGPVSEDEWKELKVSFDKLEKLKRNLDNDEIKDIRKKQIEFYNNARNIYIELNRIMNKRGFFFRIRENIAGL